MSHPLDRSIFCVLVILFVLSIHNIASSSGQQIVLRQFSIGFVRLLFLRLRIAVAHRIHRVERVSKRIERCQGLQMKEKDETKRFGFVGKRKWLFFACANLRVDSKWRWTRVFVLFFRTRDERGRKKAAPPSISASWRGFSPSRAPSSRLRKTRKVWMRNEEDSMIHSMIQLMIFLH